MKTIAIAIAALLLSGTIAASGAQLAARETEKTDGTDTSAPAYDETYAPQTSAEENDFEGTLIKRLDMSQTD